nr:hypothetical protein [Pseudomonas sp. FP1740]
MTGINRSRPGLDQALAAVRCGDALADQNSDRLARSVRSNEPKTNASPTTAAQLLLPRRPLR